MKGMVAQSVIFPNNICEETELYFRTNEKVYFENEHIYMPPNGRLSTNTYMNLFDAAAWEKYTGITKWKFSFRVKGFGKVRLKAGDVSVRELKIQCTEAIEEQILFTCTDREARFYLEAESADGMVLSDMQIWAVEIDRELVQVRIALNICTYHRQEALQHLLDVIRDSDFFRENNLLYGKLRVYVVDNASEISCTPEDFIAVYHNPNTGGSGGFTRGLVEIRKALADTGVTHVVFMDDDVEILPETFYRLYALLSLMKEGYRHEAVAGRMFRMDDKKIQYTAAEIWNGGDIRHIGFNVDMAQPGALISVNDNNGAEYGGWWFCCFPMEYAKENDPLPFFLHCDDVEYGLRHGGTPIVLNGIQVWHETYEYRAIPLITYYDTRNTLFVNKMYEIPVKNEELIENWKNKIVILHEQKDYFREYMIIRGVWDFLKGITWLKTCKSGFLHKTLAKKKGNRFQNAILWKLTYVKSKSFIKQHRNKIRRRY